MSNRERVESSHKLFQNRSRKIKIKLCVGWAVFHEISRCDMAGTLKPEERSHRMALVQSRDTKSERRIRNLPHRRGYRYRLHVREPPSSPVLVFPSRKKVVFVHGCFWHRHQCEIGSNSCLGVSNSDPL